MSEVLLEVGVTFRSSTGGKKGFPLPEDIFEDDAAEIETFWWAATTSAKPHFPFFRLQSPLFHEKLEKAGK
jgi:hypothetical protein